MTKPLAKLNPVEIIPPDPNKDPKTGRYITGGPRGGRTKGARNKLQGDFISALLDHFHQVGTAAEAVETLPRGVAAIEIVYRESPRDYLKIIASVLPKEYRIEDERFSNIGDDELGEIIETIGAEIRRLRSVETGEGAVSLPCRTETAGERE